MDDTSTAASLEDPPGAAQAGAGVFVLGVWAGLVVLALAFVTTFGPSFPRWDDFALVPKLIGTELVTWDWLWDQHNEHRVVLPKLILLGLLRLSGGDFRAGMLFNVAALAVLALGLARVGRRRLGTWRETDAFFPLALLHLGHAANLLWGWQVQFVLSTVLAGGILLLIVSRPGWPGTGKALGIGALLALLPFCGANGLALVPALALWLLAAAFARARGTMPYRRRAALACLTTAAVAIALVVLYFRGYRAASQHASDGDIAVALGTALRFAGLMFGPSASLFGSYSGIAAGSLLLASVGILVRAALTRPEERARALGLLAFLGSLGSLALGLGLGRAGTSVEAGFEPRYVTLAAPFGCVVYFAWDLYGGLPALRRLVPLGLLATMLVLSWPNTQFGIAAGQDMARQSEQFRRDVRSGTPQFLVIKRAVPFVHPSQDILTETFPSLRDARLGIFRDLRPDPAFREVEVSVTPTNVRLARWEGDTAHVTGVDPELTYVLPNERYVAGIRLGYAHANPAATPARFRMSWRRSGSASASPDASFSNWNLPTGPGRTTTIWIGDVIREFRIQPDDQPCTFRIESITLLVPEE